MTKNWVKPSKIMFGMMLGAGLLCSYPGMSQSGKGKKGKSKTKTTATKTTTDTKGEPVAANNNHKAAGVSKADMDLSASPRTNFFQYADGGWVKSHPIPATQSRWGTFSVLAEDTRAKLHSVLETASSNKNNPKGSTAQLIGDFYASGMDTNRIEQLGAKPLQSELARINAIKDKKGVMDEIAYMHHHSIGMLFNVYVDQDAKNSTQYALYAGQGGLGLPDRDYYLKTDPTSTKVRNEYEAHVGRMFQLLGYDAATATAKAKKVIEVETKLAEGSMGRLEMRDPYAIYNKRTVQQFASATPDIAFTDYMAKAGVPAVNDIILGQPKFFETVNGMLNTVSVDDWKTYMQWQYAHQMSRFLSSNFVGENFSFYGKVLSGTTKIEERWKRVQGVVDGSVGDALGQEYVKAYFSADAKKRMVEMVNNLKASLGDRIKQLDWMSPVTKEKALAKLNAIMVKIGYPDKWKDYKGLNIERDNYVQNILRADSLEQARMFAKLGKPIDRTEWGMTPPTINAYYNPALNEIVFPAGILQPPFFDPNADDAVNYGGIGAVIGHELTHGFDDEGRQFDAQGNLTNWWTKEDSANFEKRAQAIVKQFDGYTVIQDKDTLHINGKLTLGENIADLGGLTISYYAWKKSLNGKEGDVIDGFTAEQRFFLGWARVWASHDRDQALRQQILTNPHSPSNFRVNGPLSNISAFYKAFGIQEGDAMMRPASERAQIW